MTPKDVVLLSTADWDNPFWTNKQHVAVELARRGFRVLYIDSLGLRRPSASAHDLGRMASRLRKTLRRPRQVRDNLWVWSPVALPWHSNTAVRHVNRALLEIGLRAWSKMLGLRRQWLWTYNPLATELFALRSFEYRVYHCVDEIKAQPGMPVRLLEAAEEQLVQQADIVFATSPQLANSRKAWNPNTHYLPNVADFAHFNKALDSDTVVPSDIDSIPGPRLGFIGAISGYKLDFDLLRTVAEHRPAWSIVLIGKVGEGDPWTDISVLRGLPNVYFLGPRPYRALPGYLKGIDVALLPNRINDYTDAMFPMKFFEYLAAGRPVVSVALKAINDYSSVVSIASTAEEFIGAIEQALDGGHSDIRRRLRLASKYTYEGRTQRMLELISEVRG